MSFNPKGKAQIDSLTINRGQSDDANLSVVIKLTMEDQPPAVAAAVLGTDVDEVKASFFRPVSQDADQNSRFLGLKWIETNTKWDARHAIKLAKARQLRVSSLTGVSVRPRGKAMFDVAFTVRIEDPPQGFLDTIGNSLHDLVDCELEHDAELALGTPEGGQAGMPPTAKKPHQIRSGKRAVKKATKPGKSIGNKPARKKAIPRKTASGTSVN